MSYICEFCNSTLSTKYVLKNHLDTNKACLIIRNIEPVKQFKCKECKYSATDQHKLDIHHETCKYYQISLVTDTLNKKHKDKILEKDAIIIDLLRKNEELQQINFENKKIKIDYLTLEISYKELKQQYEKLEIQHERTITKLELKISQCDTFIQTLAREGSNKTVNTTHNTINNTIRNVLSSEYTLEKLETKQLEEIIRKHYTEKDFFSGQKGLANFCVERIIKTPDGKMMACCSDFARKKFKILDLNGNLKEDIEARILCQKLKVPIQIITKEMFEKISAKIEHERTRLSKNDNLQRDKLIDDSMRAQQIYIDNFNFDDLNYNQDFMHELGVLLNI
jgi:hypothetical protein